MKRKNKKKSIYEINVSSGSRLETIILRNHN